VSMSQGSPVARHQSESESEREMHPKVFMTVPVLGEETQPGSPARHPRFSAPPTKRDARLAAILASAALFRARGRAALNIFGVAVGGTIVTAIVASLVEDTADATAMTVAFAICGVGALVGCVQGIRALLTAGPARRPKGFAFLIVLFPVLGGL